MLKDKQKSAKTLPQRLAGLNKERGAWSENLARIFVLILVKA